MKATIKSFIFICMTMLVIFSSLSYGSTEALISKTYTLLYKHQETSMPLLISNGELYMSLSTLNTLFGFDTEFDGTTINITDAKEIVNQQLDENGNIYTGNLLNGQRHGEGTLFIKDGGKYEGDWKNNLYDGNGTLVLPNGDIYIGEFSLGFIHGNGKMFYPDGSYYKGDSVYGVREGFGLYYVNNDNKYTGYWKNGLRDGKGKAYIDGKYKKGIFENNQYIKNLAESNFDF